MKRINLFVIACFLQLFTVNAQNCEESFIEKFKTVWPKKIVEFNNKVNLLNKKTFNTESDSITVIYLPQLLYYKKVKFETKRKKEEFFCKVNPKSMLFYNALLKYKQKYYVILSSTGEKIELVNTYTNEEAEKRYKALLHLIQTYESNYIFTICNSNYIFIIKENKIIAFDYIHPEKELDINKIIEEITSNPLLFHYYKPIEVLCY